MTRPLPEGMLAGGRFAAWRPHPPAYVVCDVDGTLVGPADLASAGVLDAVGRARAAGVRVGYATGRSRDAVARLHDQLGAAGPHVLHNGAEIRAEGATVAAWNLSPTQVQALLELAFGRRDTYVEIYLETGFLVSSRDERARPHWDILGREPDGLIASADELEGRRVMKATFAVFEDDAVADLERRITGMGLMAGTAGSPRTPHLTYINATHPEADKGRAVAHAARYLGITLDEVVAVGDAANDLSMLEVVGTAIAMGQAPAPIRSVCHLVVPDVGADGVAVALDAVGDWLGVG